MQGTQTRPGFESLMATLGGPPAWIDSTMYCPKCGGVFVETSGALRCMAGGMELSPRMLERLEARIRGDSYKRVEFMQQVHGNLRWFCHGCGRRLGPQLDCESCGFDLRGLVYELIELHPHG